MPVRGKLVILSEAGTSAIRGDYMGERELGHVSNRLNEDDL
jgi:hypothetical protein